MPPMTDLVDQVRNALATVQDPDLHQDLVALDMVRGISVVDGVARFQLVLTTGACPVKQQLEDQCRAAACSVPGVASAEIAVSAEVPKRAARADVLPGVRHLIGVGSGKGGVGKSTVTVNLACALAATGARVGLLDADIYGPSVPLMMGVNKQPYVIDKKMVPLERHGVKIISMGFLLEAKQAVMLRGPMVGKAVEQLVTDVRWGELDYLLIDLPPGTGDVQMSLAQTVPLAGVVVVSTPQAVALADARRSVAMFDKLNIAIFGIVENMSEFVCPQLRPRRGDLRRGRRREGGARTGGALPRPHPARAGSAHRRRRRHAGGAGRAAEPQRGGLHHAGGEGGAAGEHLRVGGVGRWEARDARCEARGPGQVEVSDAWCQGLARGVVGWEAPLTLVVDP